MERSEPGSATAARAGWLRLLALAPANELAARLAELEPLPAVEVLRPPELGLAMVRGRAGGTGMRFNLGEITVTRCAVRLPGGPLGIGYVAGRDPAKAKQVALADALLQTAEHHDRVQRGVLAPLAASLAARRAAAAGQAAATRVEFFTLAREASEA
jgi:alpha-D-ribose 1-methylphosphonate 5-triphosphate synthase subunit PhnG